MFEFHLSTRIVFGRGELARAGALMRELGRRAVLIRGGAHLDRSGVVDRLVASLRAEGIEVVPFVVSGEPEIATAESALRTAREASCDCVIGLGGGSALDVAKAVAGMMAQEGQVLDYLEVVGGGRVIDRPGAPLIAVPTTAGTGTEVTRNAVIAVPAKRFKASMRSPHLLPRIALIDPSATDALPPELTASTGLDALTQLIEALVSVRAHPLTDGIALSGLRLAARSLRRAFDHGSDAAARDDMALAALMSGICLANAGLGAVHGLAAPLGASFAVPHGVACAVLLPHVMRVNVQALEQRLPASPALARYAEVGRVLTGQTTGEDPQDRQTGIVWVENLVGQLKIPRLAGYGVGESDLVDVAARAQAASSIKGNPVALTEDELLICLRRAL